MERFIYYNELLDIYGVLLTEKSYKIMEYYYKENLSTGEIAELMDVSRSFIGNAIKKAEVKLEHLESILHNYKTTKALKELLEGNLEEQTKKKIEEIINI